MAHKLPVQIIEATQQLSEGVEKMEFSPPTEYVYNPLRYAWKPHESYLNKYAHGPKKVVFMGMNPGPFGMAQTGVPFGEVDHVRDWLGINEVVDAPEKTHPKRPIEGFSCQRSEVSGRRLWGTFKQRFGTAESFFEENYVTNYCPLVFMEASGKNRTPDKMPAAELNPLYALCDKFLCSLIEAMQPEWIIGVGAFAENRAREALKGYDLKFGRILHPSPASPAANRGWAEQAEKQLKSIGVW
ncbi:MAG: uracil-DNA glycosylase family protein [Verrucomicrobiota bacterium]